MTTANAIHCEALHAAGFLQTQTQRCDTLAGNRSGNQRLQAPSQCFAIDAERIADIFEGERASDALAENPRPRFIKGGPFSGAAGILALAALAASSLPALQASRVDPAITLRHE